MSTHPVKTALIELEEMEFYAYHGCFKEEQVVGNKFRVNIAFAANCALAAQTDNVADTVNYVRIYDIAKSEMAHKSHLLEHVANRMVESISNEFPQISGLSVKISKLNPPVGGHMKQVSVTIKK